ncbi:MAG: dihydrodipicolinate synthase family protein, partial [Burkholderiaceae bacterium]|nr:dihydrodipicolinate synthase family protein [Burkholderiaceae bacterium]
MAALTEAARGVYLIAATPFTDSGALDLDSTDRLVDFYLQHGADGLTLLGVMGEAPKLTMAEARAFVARVLARVRGRVPVVVGVSAPGLAALRELAASATDLGAAGVMVAPAAGLRTDEQIVAYFESVAEAIG